MPGVTGTLSQVTLTMTLAKPTKWWGYKGRIVDAHRLTESFTEGNGFVRGQPKGLRDRGDGSGVTWNCATDTDISNRKANCDDRWKGGSEEIEPLTDSTLITNGQTGEVSWDVTVDVQAAVANEDTEIQWMLKKLKSIVGAVLYFFPRKERLMWEI